MLPTRRPLRLTFTLAVVASLLAAGCDGCADERRRRLDAGPGDVFDATGGADGDAGVEAGEETGRDTTEFGDALDGESADADGSRTGDATGDGTGGLPGLNCERQAGALGSYVCGGDTGLVRYPDVERPFRKPQRNHGVEQRETRRDYLERYHGSLPETAYSIGADPSLAPDAYAEQLFADSDQDVTYYIATIHPRQNYGDSHLEYVLLLNYRPVEATWEHMNSTRTSVLDTQNGSSASIPVDDDIELLTVTIPAERFARDGMYDVTIGWSMIGDIDYSSTWKKSQVYHGGYTKPDHPCMRRQKLHKWDEAEWRISKKYFAKAYLHPLGKYENRDYFPHIDADGGETVDLSYGILSYSRTNASFAAVLVKNGEPTRKRRFLFAPDQERRSSGAYPIGYRDQFTVRIPDQPGTYDFEIALVPEPFLVEDGCLPPELSRATTDSTRGSNHITFVVDQN